jgi:hypothetical protein
MGRWNLWCRGGFAGVFWEIMREIIKPGGGVAGGNCTKSAEVVSSETNVVYSAAGIDDTGEGWRNSHAEKVNYYEYYQGIIMIKYNVSVSVPQHLAGEWESWMREKHIADVVATGKFVSAQLWRVLEPESADIVQFSVEYIAENLAEYEEYRAIYAPVLQADHTEIFGTRVVASRRVLREIQMW